MARESYIIGVCGGSGSGKTTFMNSLRQQLADQKVCYISLDDYYYPRDKQHTDAQGVRNFDLPSSINVTELISDLSRIRQGEIVIKEKYTFNNTKEAPSQLQYEPAPVIIIEGLFIYHYEELRHYFDLKLFIDAKTATKLNRRIKRDKTERNYPLDDVMYRYENHVLPAFEQYIKPYKSEADFVINNEDKFDEALKVVISYIRNELMDQRS